MFDGTVTSAVYREILKHFMIQIADNFFREIGFIFL